MGNDPTSSGSPRTGDGPTWLNQGGPTDEEIAHRKTNKWVEDLHASAEEGLRSLEEWDAQTEDANNSGVWAYFESGRAAQAGTAAISRIFALNREKNQFPLARGNLWSVLYHLVDLADQNMYETRGDIDREESDWREEAWEDLAPTTGGEEKGSG